MPRKRQSLLEPPDLPHELHPAMSANLDDNARFMRVALTDCSMNEQTADDVLFDQVRCKRVNFSQSQFKLAQMLDVVLDTCDLTATTWEKAHLQRVELHGCRMTGTKFDKADFDNVRFERISGEYAQFWSCSFKMVMFDHCDVREASFENSNLAGVIFRNCDLSRADFRGAKLAGADLRGSIVANMQIGLTELRGAIVDPQQAIQVAALLGMMVKDVGDA